MSQANEYLAIAVLLCLFVALCSVICSLVTLYLIFILKKRNGFLSILIAMTSCQVIYDCSFFAVPWYGDSTGYRIQNFLANLGGYSTTLFSNVLSAVLYYIVLNLRTIDVSKYFWKYAAAPIITISLVIAVTGLFFTGQAEDIFNWVYYTARLASILFNFVMYFMVSRKLTAMGISGTPDRKGQIHPLYVLARRLQYYPVIQALSRLGGAWYEAAYANRGLGYDSSASDAQITSMFLIFILTPIAGIGYFVVFLLLQPRAYELFLSSCCCCCCCCSLCKSHSLEKFTKDNQLSGHNESLCVDVVATDGQADGNSCIGTAGSGTGTRNPLASTDIYYNSPHNSRLSGVAKHEYIDVNQLDEDELLAKSVEQSIPHQALKQHRSHSSNGRAASNSRAFSTSSLEAGNATYNDYDDDENI